LALQDVKQEQSNELSIIAELSGNSLDAYFLHYQNALKLLAGQVKNEQDTINQKQSQKLLQ
jgi:hypothetical protein